MQSIINRLRGQIRIQAEGAYPERLLNLCAAHGILFWNPSYESETCLHLTLSPGALRRLLPLAERAMCTVTPLNHTGLPFFLARFRRRYAFLFGAFLCLMAILILSQFVIEVKVVGNKAVSTDRILTELHTLGLRAGAYGPSVDSNLLEQALLLQIPELCYFTVNLSGCRATVIVRERIPKPEIIDMHDPTNVVAEKAGLITRVRAYEGMAKVSPGATVLPGELLISGVDDIESAAGDGSATGARFLHAMGEVYARTYYTRSAQTPLTALSKTYTGQKKHHLSLLLGDLQINFHTNGRIPFPNYDKIKQTNQLTLPFGITLPFAVQTETFAEYTLSEVPVNRASAQQFLQASLLSQLQRSLKDGALLAHRFETTEEQGMLTVTLICECEEQIGRLVALPVEP